LGSSNHLTCALAASRGLDVAGLPVKKLSFHPTSAREMETPRKPFAPLVSNNTVPLIPSHQQNTLMTPSHHHHIPITPSQHVPVTPSQQNIPTTPSQHNIPLTPSQQRTTFSEAAENMTPKTVMPIPTPKTPMTVSVPMQVATTPAPACVAYEVVATTKTPDVTDFSFEERRLAYYLSR